MTDTVVGWLAKQKGVHGSEPRRVEVGGGIADQDDFPPQDEYAEPVHLELRGGEAVVVSGRAEGLVTAPDPDDGMLAAFGVPKSRSASLGNPERGEVE